MIINKNKNIKLIRERINIVSNVLIMEVEQKVWSSYELELSDEVLRQMYKNVKFYAWTTDVIPAIEEFIDSFDDDEWVKKVLFRPETHYEDLIHDEIREYMYDMDNRIDEWGDTDVERFWLNGLEVE